VTSSQADPPVSGLLEGKYQLVGLIGRGGMGSVWEARHASLGTRFAIKFIEAEYADSAEARSRFDKEAKLAATIQSKHAIQIFDHGVTKDGKPYIVMELLVGDPLDKLIDSGRSIDLAQTANILQQVSRGLGRAHERGVVHRDLKPENIFIVKDDEDGGLIAKVLDFGIAKINSQGAPSGVTSSTKTGAVLGTPFYMSPEQARGLRTVDHRTDIWSIGVIAFRCVTGKLPFDGESVGDLLVKICTGAIPLPSSVRPGLPRGFDEWFMRSLEREPDRRFQTVGEQASALMAVAGLGGGPYSGASAPMSPYGAGAGSGAQPPAFVQTPMPGQMPGPMQGAGQAGYGSSPNAQPMPPAGAMTAAPFTSSQPVPKVSSGRGRIVAGVAVVAALVGMGVGGGVYWKKAHDARLGRATGIAPQGAISVANDGTPPLVPVDAPPVESVAPLATASTAPKPTAEEEPAPKHAAAAPARHAPASSKTTTKPSASEKPATKPPVEKPATTHEAPSKKPPKADPDDPGY
jgi:serine/threonine-protein kinase